MNRVYFKGFAEIRAIAAISVLLHHVELYKKRSGIFSLYDTPLKHFIEELGKNGVYIFFILSGFLITYLLLAEKHVKNKIDLKKFYFRRILRIWPLYYFIILISFFLIPFLANNLESLQGETNYYHKILLFQQHPHVSSILFILFLPNLALALRPAIVGASQSWSVGVEEQFYIIWPHIINKVKHKKHLLITFILISVIPIISSIVVLITPEISDRINFIINLLPIHYMAIGAIGAYFSFYNKALLNKILTQPYLFILNSSAFFVFIFIAFDFYGKYLMFSLITLFQILFISNEQFKINLRSKFLEKIGSISYGIYMYHPFVMYLSYAFFNSIIPIKNLVLYNIFIYSSITIGTLIVSQISYTFFEKKFIDLKNRKFTVISSGKK